MHVMRRIPLAMALSALGCGGALAADPTTLDWSAAPKTELTLFYPGQASQEWIFGENHKSGAKALRKGEGCLECHDGEEEDLGETIVTGKKLEPGPIAGKPGSKKVSIQAAYDKEYFYLKASWPAKTAGAFHEYLVYRGGKWDRYATYINHPSVKSGKAKVSYEDRFNVMLGDGKAVPDFNNQGCWVTCHNDLRHMPNEPTAAALDAHPVLGKAGMKKDESLKYLRETRTEIGPTGGWDKLKSKAELDALWEQGVKLDLWQWRAARSGPVDAASDDHVFQSRNADVGKTPFFKNWDGAKKQPKVMYDPAKNGGAAALAESQFRDLKAPRLKEDNSIAYDPNRAWKEGDLLPRYANRKPAGSEADVMAKSDYANGMWTVYFRRKLATANKDDVALVPGQTFPISFSLHDDNVTTRYHYVSFPLKLTLGGKEGQIKAVELK
ncbi:MAG TPA: hypothetical protein DHV08_03955 [Rhodocyclaceae bacterium]|nr:MAG: hypothetical protein COW56_08350 [Rhodocyclales bacterium CG17_big_fil_post_rev_8_21_14_2_50_68_7]PJA57027.1 MAG: hypothetical protein CO164_10110 [Rhodocyclales bacterium CG_4_9_14_3_um_filter_68_10]HCX32769.1 hypothetical protein [Rhodocyclaceae bacterium]